MSDPFPVVIHHNPDCGTSRNVLAMIEAAGYTPTVVLYLQTGWTIPQLQALFAAMGFGPREVLRDKATPAKELGLLEAEVTDETILREMVAPNPCEPASRRHAQGREAVPAVGDRVELLDRQPEHFTKEDGEVVRP